MGCGRALAGLPSPMAGAGSGEEEADKRMSELLDEEFARKLAEELNMDYCTPGGAAAGTRHLKEDYKDQERRVRYPGRVRW